MIGAEGEIELFWDMLAWGPFKDRDPADIADTEFQQMVGFSVRMEDGEREVRLTRFIERTEAGMLWACVEIAVTA